jgi:site-specific DNA-methyltransferase (adenine-specific)
MDFFNEDCITGMKNRLSDNSIGLIFTDPPYGINGDALDTHYNRDEDLVIPGYVDVPLKDYAVFSMDWIKECERVLKPGGSMYIVSGYTGLYDIMTAVRNTNLIEVNHMIWHYNFGVYTTLKYVSSHYHILYLVKPPEKVKTFNTFCRYGKPQGSYNDRQDVIIEPRDYRPGEIKNRNQLPESLVRKFIEYSSNKGDLVLDPFMGGFTTAKVALELDRLPIGFELNKNAFDHFVPLLSTTKVNDNLFEF